MAGSLIRIGLAGCGYAARVHLDRLNALPGARVVGFADPDLDAARRLAALVPADPGLPDAEAFADHRDLLRTLAPDALAVFTPHLGHYRAAMDGLQADCHLFIEKPLSTNLQEAVDIVGLARGRNRLVGVGHQYRLRPSLVEARRRLGAGTIGSLRLVTATLAQPWLAAHGDTENSWRFAPSAPGGGILADAGDHLIDALLWTTGRVATEAAAVQHRADPAGPDLVTAVALRLSDGTPATLAVSGVSAGSLFELNYFGESGRLRATDLTLEEESGAGGLVAVPLPTLGGALSVDGNFVAAVASGVPLCCPAEEAIETVRLLEAIARSAATGQAVSLT